MKKVYRTMVGRSSFWKGRAENVITLPKPTDLLDIDSHVFAVSGFFMAQPGIDVLYLPIVGEEI